jgi:hypothetical protein
MKYDERIGESKLSVLRDGVRFLQAILTSALCYRPEALFLMGFVGCFLVSVLLAMYPTEFYIEQGYVKEWMIYRFVVCFLLGAVGFLFLCAVAIAQQMVTLRGQRRESDPFWSAAAARLFRGKILWVLTGSAVLTSVVLVWPGLVEYSQSGQVTLHWSRVIVAAFGLLLAFEATVTWLLLQILKLWAVQDLARDNTRHAAGSLLKVTSARARPGKLAV